jgi:hypothetical protein
MIEGDDKVVSAIYLEAGYVLVDGERITLTEYGQQVRIRIEEETDRIYFIFAFHNVVRASALEVCPASIIVRRKK